MNDSDLSVNYTVIDIVKIDPPEGMPEGDWFKYIIGQGSSKIEGIRNGSLKSVTEHAQDFAENLNNRTRHGYSAYSQRIKKK